MHPNPFGLEQRPGGTTAGSPFALLHRPLSGGPSQPPAIADLTWAEPRPVSEAPMIGEVRDLDREEAEQALRLLATPAAPTNASMPAVRRLRAWHHALARDMVSGLSDTDLARAYGCSVLTLDRLRRSPAFQSLLAAYLKAPEEEALGMAAKLRAVTAKAVDHLEELLDGAAPGSLPSQFLEKILFGLLDRTGHTPVQKSVNLSAGVSAEYLAQLKESLNVQAVVIDAREGDGAGAGPAQPFLARPDPFGAEANEPPAPEDLGVEVGAGSRSPRAAAAA